MNHTAPEICAQMKNDLRCFTFLSEADTEILSPYFECRQGAAGTVLWNEGDESKFAVFVMSGRIEEKKNTEFEGRQMVIGVYSEGSVIGEFSLIDDLPRAVTAVCLEDAQLLLMPRENFDRLLVEHPELGLRFLKGVLLTLSIRLRKSFERLVAIF
ncbi:Crp/Fnr family transcriptional regulator [Trichloromonas sp.]|uniref:Crp/Fnr family transcriptional regulator n=1 Tax=Trichloromonas sp. TaxID=3069249 RepID=UPI002A3E8CD6|nr:cyclic nucleotide-binding domain-containing protein [Trichloromonas sp.]